MSSTKDPAFYCAPLHDMFSHWQWKQLGQGMRLETNDVFVTCSSDAMVEIKANIAFAPSLEWKRRGTFYWASVPPQTALPIRVPKSDVEQPHIMIEALKVQGEVLCSTKKEFIRKDYPVLKALLFRDREDFEQKR